MNTLFLMTEDAADLIRAKIQMDKQDKQDNLRAARCRAGSMNANKDGEYSVRLSPFKDDTEGRIMVSTYDINNKIVAAYYPMTVEQASFAATCVLNGRPIPKPNEIDEIMNGCLIQKLSQAMIRFA